MTKSMSGGISPSKSTVPTFVFGGEFSLTCRKVRALGLGDSATLVTAMEKLRSMLAGGEPLSVALMLMVYDGFAS